ncbi:MAG: cupredoxin domain-containing protein [Burkholderiaceae bacterium]
MKRAISLNAAMSVAVLTFGLSTASFVAHAHGEARQEQLGTPASFSAEDYAAGKQGDPDKVVRTVTIDMNDRMRFDPAEITVMQGETIRFVVANQGRLMHEMVIGTKDELKQHAELMRKFPEMVHDEPYMSHVSPGKKEELIWQFTQAGEFYYACLIPGHSEAGMVGKIKVIEG